MPVHPNVPVGAVVPGVHVFPPAADTTKVAYWFPVTGAIVKPFAQSPLTVNDSTVKAVKVAVPVSAAVTLHSLIAVTRAFLPWLTRALCVISVKFGSATATNMASTATTTTSSINEKPSSPGFFARISLVLGLER